MFRIAVKEFLFIPYDCCDQVVPSSRETPKGLGVGQGRGRNMRAKGGSLIELCLIAYLQEEKHMYNTNLHLNRVLFSSFSRRGLGEQL